MIWPLLIVNLRILGLIWWETRYFVWNNKHLPCLTTLDKLWVSCRMPMTHFCCQIRSLETQMFHIFSLLKSDMDFWKFCKSLFKNMCIWACLCEMIALSIICNRLFPVVLIVDHVWPVWSGCKMTCFCYLTGTTTIIYSVHKHNFESLWLWDVNCGNSHLLVAVFWDVLILSTFVDFIFQIQL